MQHTGAPDMGRWKLNWFIWLSYLCCATIHVSCCRGLPPNRDVSASPQEDLLRLTSPVKAQGSTEEKPPTYFTELSPILLFHSGLLSTPDFTVYDVRIWGSVSFQRKKKRHEWHVWIFFATCFLVTATDPRCAAEFLNASDPSWVLWCMPKTKPGKCPLRLCVERSQLQLPICSVVVVNASDSPASPLPPPQPLFVIYSFL